MERSRQEKVQIGFLVVWLVFWTAGILVAVVTLGGVAWQGEPVPALVLVIWLAAAGFALWQVANKLVRLLLHGRPPPRPVRDHDWQDGVVDRRRD
jgi:hypothetical protein